MTERKLNAGPGRNTTRAARARRRAAAPTMRAEARSHMDHSHVPEHIRPRRRRGPLNAHRRRLAVHNKNPDYEYRWFVDRNERIRDAYDDDWDFVVRTEEGEHAISDDPGTNLSQVANKTHGGERHYLMAKPKVYYEEDQRQKQKRIDAVDEAIFRNRRAQGASNQQTLPTADDDAHGQFYIPTSSPRHMVKGE